MNEQGFEQDRQFRIVASERSGCAISFAAGGRPCDARTSCRRSLQLVEANRLLMPIDHVTGWVFRVARNRITDLWRKQKPEDLQRHERRGRRWRVLGIEDLFAIARCGPEALTSAACFLMSWNLRSTSA